MILKYYNGYVSLDRLDELLNTSKSGISAFNIVQVLDSLGFKSRGIRFNNLTDMQLPCIAHVIIDHSYKHYMVLYKIDYKREKILVADPSLGLKKMSFDEFLNISTGIIVEMQPVRKIMKEKEPNILLFILNLIRNNYFLIILVGFFSLISGILSIANSLFIQKLFDSLNGPLNSLLPIIFLFLLMIILRILFDFVRNILLTKLNKRLDRKLSLDIFKQIINLPYRYYRDKTTGEITSYFNDLSLIRDAIGHISIIIFINIPIITILFFFLLIFNYKVCVFNFIICIGYFFVYLFYKNKNLFFVNQAILKRALMNSYMTEVISGFETVKNLNCESKVENDFKSKYDEYLITNKKINYLYNNQFLIKEVIYYLGLGLIMIYVVLNNPNNVITYFMTSSLLLSSFREVLDFDFEFKNVITSIRNISQLLVLKNKNKIRKRVFGNILIKNLEYSFKNKVLKNINLKIDKGTKIMVTGPSGSGKSTLFKILKGYYDNYVGNVMIDNLEGKNYIFENVIYVSSKEILFSGTLEDNLTFRGFVSDNICELDDITDDFKLIIQEDGFNLSSGQKQRIVLARALYDFNVLIIDEGLNQVSEDMERVILKNLFKEYEDKTIIVISHRMGNLDLFDRLLKIEDGRIVLDEMRNN